MIRIIAEWTLKIDEELCICFIHWQKAFDCVNWTKLMQILRRSGIDWHERRLISKLYMDQRVKVWLDWGETRSVQIGRGVRQGCCLLFNCKAAWKFCYIKECTRLDKVKTIASNKLLLKCIYLPQALEFQVRLMLEKCRNGLVTRPSVWMKALEVASSLKIAGCK